MSKSFSFKIMSMLLMGFCVGGNVTFSSSSWVHTGIFDNYLNNLKLYLNFCVLTLYGFCNFGRK